MTLSRASRTEDRPTLVIGHRANTLTALARLGRRGIVAVECDVTKDSRGRIVVGHPGHVSQATLRRCPTLLAYLRPASRSPRKVFVDLKLRSINIPTFVDEFTKVVTTSGFRGELIITSDCEAVLRRFRVLGFPTGHIVRAPFVSHRCSSCSLELIPAAALSRAGLTPGRKEVHRVVATEVDDPRALRIAMGFEVGEVMTNIPVRLHAELSKVSGGPSR